MSNALPVSLRKWTHCKRCANLATWRRHVVVGQGDLPARVLFIGEAPDRTADLLGDPFAGPSGQILDRAMRDAARFAKIAMPTYYTTLVLACRPCDVWMGEQRPPAPEEIARCLPRLVRIVTLARPERVIFLGDVAQHECKRLCPDGVKLRHPGFVARKGGVGSVGYRTFVRGLAEVFQSLRESNS